MQTINNLMTENQISDLFSLAVQLQVKAEESDDRDTAILAYSIQNACSNLTESRREFRAADATIHNLELKLTDQAVQLANAESKCRDLPAENAHARERHVFIRALAVSILEHSGGRMDWRGAMEDATELLQTVDSVYAKTPATDAFLAEVRAQVWIEGSEPEEFGRYWVRYETDVGPHYCSAQWMEHNFCAGSNTNIHKIWLADHSWSINSLRGVTHYTRLPDSLEAAEKQNAELRLKSRLLENADRDIAALRQRIAELEAREVTLPEALNSYAGVKIYRPNDVIEAIRAAGIGVKGE